MGIPTGSLRGRAQPQLHVAPHAQLLPHVQMVPPQPEQVQTSVSALGLADEPEIVDGSHVEHAKPAPDLLLLAAERLGLPPARCWYVGDSTWDIRAAVAAQMPGIGVTAGAAVGADVLAEAGAERVVADLAELAALLRLSSFGEAALAPAP